MLAEAVSVLCKNGLSFNTALSIEGLIGITIDSGEVLLVSLKDMLYKESVQKSSSPLEGLELDSSDNDSCTVSPKAKKVRHNRKKSRNTNSHSMTHSNATERSNVCDVNSECVISSPVDMTVKQEPYCGSDEEVVIVKEEEVAIRLENMPPQHVTREFHGPYLEPDVSSWSLLGGRSVYGSDVRIPVATSISQQVSCFRLHQQNYISNIT